MTQLALRVPSAGLSLSYPLSKKALADAFGALMPGDIEVTRTAKWQEAAIDGAWPLSQLRAHFRALGFHPTGAPDQLLFVNEAQDVGLQCMGVEPHPSKNTWKAYSIEVQARPKPQEAARTARQTSTLLWHNP